MSDYCTDVYKPHRVKVPGLELLYRLELENRKEPIDETSERKAKRLEKNELSIEKKKNETAERLKKRFAYRKQIDWQNYQTKSSPSQNRLEQTRKRIICETESRTAHETSYRKERINE